LLREPRPPDLIMADFVEVARLDQIAPGRSWVVTVAGQDVALFNVDGSVYAINDSCAHAGASLANGILEGKIVTCRAHGRTFDVTTGVMGGIQGTGVASYPVEVKDGKILVAVPPPIARESTPQSS
jgi:3-phenylpropionate/trans-cinnamate dioxygenase ferredoxin subunit